MNTTTRVSRSFIFGTLLGLLAVGSSVSAETAIERARQGYLPQAPAGIETTLGSQQTVDVEAVAARYTYQPQEIYSGSATGELDYPDAIAQAREAYVYKPKAQQTGPEQVARN